jgi:hypothetical protein
VTRPTKFAPDFRARAIHLYRFSEGRTIADVARIGTETFRTWANMSSRLGTRRSTTNYERRRNRFMPAQPLVTSLTREGRAGRCP